MGKRKFTNDKKGYVEFLMERKKSENNEWEPGYGVCYCGHTTYCACSDPDYKLFLYNNERGVIS
jgi:hypothetical protein